ncbi:cytochrome P450 [Aspergillus floccosus]
MLAGYTLLLALAGIFLGDYVVAIYRNIRRAQRTGLPYVVAPLPWSVPMMILLETTWIPYIIHNWLPLWLADTIDDPMNNFRWRIKNRQAKRYGGVYLVVTAKAVICSVADAAVVSQIVNARSEFPKPVWQYKVIQLYGPNLVTCEDKEWAHHRRHTATTFNERNNELVWKESIRQATEMLHYWRKTASRRPDTLAINDISEDIVQFSLNVISGAGFGVQIPFKPSVARDNSPNDADIFQDTASPPPGFDFTFRSVVAYTDVKIRTVVFANLMLPRWLRRPLVPLLKRDFAAHRDLENYMKRLIETGSASFAGTQRTKETASNLIHGMLASRADQTDKSKGLSDREIISNMHIFTLAGHGTTETLLKYAFVLLALYPRVQEWLHEGILDAVKSEFADPAEWDYATVFPKMITPLCVMLETMRLYPPVITVPKWTGASPSRINYRGRDVVLDAGISINLNMNALHYSEEYWGADAETFDPTRWDARNSSSFLAQYANTPGLVAPGLEYPTVHRPVRGSYIPFSDGFRACLGKKFAQVEFVAALAVVFRAYRVRLADESHAGRRQAERALRESVSVVTLGMVEGVPLVFERV